MFLANSAEERESRILTYRERVILFSETPTRLNSGASAGVST